MRCVRRFDAGICSFSSGLSESNRLRADSRDVASCHNNCGTIVFNTETQSRAETNLRSTMGDNRAVLFRVIIYAACNIAHMEKGVTYVRRNRAILA